MRLKIFFTILAFILTSNNSVFARASDQPALNQTMDQATQQKIEQQIKDTATQQQKAVSDIKDFLPSSKDLIINQIDKNGTSITEINSDILLKEDNHPILFFNKSLNDPITLDALNENIIVYKNRSYQFTDSPVFRFQIDNAPNNHVDLSFNGQKIRLKTQNYFVEFDGHLKIQQAKLSIVSEAKDFPISFYPSALFDKAVNHYKNYQIDQGNLVFSNGVPQYQIKLTVNGKILGLFNTSFDLDGTMDVQTGKINISHPWWEAFVF